MKEFRRRKRLSAETIELIEKYTAIVLGAAEAIEKLIDLFSGSPR
jgi:hypothetical protein